MATTAARTEANRKNLVLSTGPRTPEGKARSRANALKEGFTADQLRTPADQAAAAQVSDSGWMAEEVAIILGRLTRLHEVEERERERVMLRAERWWDDDRMLEAETIGGGLARRPSEVMARLQSFPQGCRWMITRWNKLARIAEADLGWNEAERSIAFDLLGVPAELRKGQPGERFTPDGLIDEAASQPAIVARGQVHRLGELVEELAEIDDFDRETSCLGLHRGDGPADRRHRSYELALHRRLKTYLKPLEFVSPSPEREPEPLPIPGREIPVLVEIEAMPSAPVMIEAMPPVPVEIEAMPPVPAEIEAIPSVPVEIEAMPSAPVMIEAGLPAPREIDPRLLAPWKNEAKMMGLLNRQDRRAIKAEKRRIASDRKLDRRREDSPKVASPTGL